MKGYNEMNLWDEDVTLNIEGVINLIEEQFKPIKVTDISFIGNGFDNNVYTVNNKYLFRFPRRSIADNLIKKEGYILPIISQYVRTPIPYPQFQGNPSDNYPYHFLGYNYLHGYSVEEVESIDGVNSIKVLAEFLSNLHSIPAESVVNIIGYDELGRVNVTKRKNTLIKNAEAIRRLGICDTSQLELYIYTLPEMQVDDENVLVHGDLHIRNLLYDVNGIVSSVIDFGDIHVGHRACDLAIIYSIIPNKYRYIFFEEYGQVSEATLNIARFRAILTNTYLFLNAHDSENMKLIDKVIQSLNNALT